MSQFNGNSCTPNKRRCRVVLHCLVELNWSIGSSVWVLACGHFVDYNSKRPNITGVGVLHAQQPFWRHVTKCTCVGSSVFFLLVVLNQLLANTEIAKLSKSEVRFNQDVVGFQVPVYLFPFVVHESQCL